MVVLEAFPFQCCDELLLCAHQHLGSCTEHLLKKMGVLSKQQDWPQRSTSLGLISGRPLPWSSLGTRWIAGSEAADVQTKSERGEGRFLLCKCPWSGILLKRHQKCLHGTGKLEEGETCSLMHYCYASFFTNQLYLHWILTVLKSMWGGKSVARHTHATPPGVVQVMELGPVCL